MHYMSRQLLKALSNAVSKGKSIPKTGILQAPQGLVKGFKNHLLRPVMGNQCTNPVAIRKRAS